MDLSLALPAFIAGMLTFLAPCTLPLVPGYLGFISGVSINDLKSPQKVGRTRARIFLNGVFYVIGFSAVFILLGTLFGVLGSALAGYRVWLTRLGGVFVVFFGLYMTGVIKLAFLESEQHVHVGKHLKPGRPTSSLVFGGAFALGWTPCVGPVLGSILTLAAAGASVAQGAALLAIFSMGLAVPFLAIALGIGAAAAYIGRISRYLRAISVIGGVFLVFLGVLLLTGQFSTWVGLFYQLFGFINYDQLLNYL